MASVGFSVHSWSQRRCCSLVWLAFSGMCLHLPTSTNASMVGVREIFGTSCQNQDSWNPPSKTSRKPFLLCSCACGRAAGGCCCCACRSRVWERWEGGHELVHGADFDAAGEDASADVTSCLSTCLPFQGGANMLEDAADEFGLGRGCHTSSTPKLKPPKKDNKKGRKIKRKNK